MKQFKFLFILVLFISFSSCEQEEVLTENPDFIPTATGDDPGIPPTGGVNGGNTGGGNTGGGNTGGVPSDFLASTEASNRVAVLEDFTGVRCGFCPAGHVIAESIESSLGDDFIAIAVHASGSYSAPAPGTDWPNFQSPWGNPIKVQADPSGYPAGSLNRMKASDLGVSAQKPPNGMAMSRGSWGPAANVVVGMTSPVNIGAKATISGSTLTVEVDVYYTEDETETNHINVLMLQNGLTGRQSGGTPDPMNYTQNHVLRHSLTDQWGDPITESTNMGDYVRKTYTYEVPSDYNGTGPDGGGAVVHSDLEVVAFITRGQKDILTAVDVDVD